MKKSLIFCLLAIFFAQNLFSQTVELVKDINTTGITSGNLTTEGIVTFNNKMYYTMVDEVQGIFRPRLYTSDGTEAGTNLVSETVAGVELLTVYNNKIYFFGINNNKTSLFSSDGTSSGTILIKEISEFGIPQEMVVCNGKLFFTLKENSTYGKFLWASDGQISGTSLVKDFGSGSIYGLFSHGNTLLFTGADNSTDRELWKSDGTISGTILLKNLNGTSDWSQPTNYCLFNGFVYFYTLSTSPAIWKTDGTAAGTTIFKSFSSSVSSLYASSTYLLFSNFNDLWKSDGTVAGSFIISNNLRGVKEYCEYNGNVYFQAFPYIFNSSNENTELYKTDGTAAGTNLFKELETGFYDILGTLPVGSKPRNLKVVNNKLHFLAESNNWGVGTKIYWGEDQTQFWVSDGTSVNTIPLKRFLRTGTLSAFSNQCVFIGSENEYGIELWKSNGTVFGTSIIKNQNLNTKNGYNFSNIVFNNNIYFSANDGINGNELWKSDGTNLGTELVKDISPNLQNYPGIISSSMSSPPSFVEYGNHILFIAEKQLNTTPITTEYKIYKSDGTNQGTQIFTPTNLPADYKTFSGTNKLRKLGNWMIFKNSNNDITYKSNLLQAYPISTLTNPQIESGLFFNNKIFTIRHVSGGSYELVSYDIDTDAIEVLVSNLYYGAKLYLVQNSVFLNGLLNIENSKNHLYKTNGTVSGTSLISNNIYTDFTVLKESGNTIVFSGNQNNLTNEESTNAPSDYGIYKYDGINLTYVHSTSPYPDAILFLEKLNTNQMLFGKYGFDVNGDVENYTIYNLNFQTNSISTVKIFLHPTYYGVGVGNFYYFNNRLFFVAATNNQTIKEVWTTDGTPAGTVKILNNYVVGTYFEVNNKLFLYTQNNNGSLNLYSSNGSIAGTFLEKGNFLNQFNPNLNIIRINNNEVFGTYEDNRYGVELFKITFENPCPSSLSISTPNYTTETLTRQASTTNGLITATNQISNTAKISYQSKAILLSTGFIAQPTAGGYFKAEVGGCN